MTLDIPTLAVVGTMVGVTLAVCLSVLAWLVSGPRALRLWALSFWLGTLGALFLGVRQSIPEVVSALGANTCLPLSRFLMLQGVLLYVHRPLRKRWRPLLFIFIYVALIAWFLLVQPNLAVRLYLFSAQAVLWNGLIVWALLRHGPSDVRLSNRIAAAVFAGELIFDAVRPLLAMRLAAGQDFMHTGRAISASYLVSIVGAICLFTALVLIVIHRLVVDLGREARTDQLTGLINRRALMEEGTRALELCRRTELPCALLLFDLDRFKTVNDTYGHAAGDEVLRNFVQVVRGAGRRASDLFARYGGEEFALLLSGVPPEGAAIVAERLCAAVAAAPILVHEKAITVTVSIGVAARANSGPLDELIAQADQALYAAKAAGRNCVRVAPGPAARPAGPNVRAR